MKSSERHFFHYTERTYHCFIMHIFKKQKQKQSIIKLNKQSINLTWYAMWIDFRNKNMFRSCIMKLKWTNSNVATSPIFDGLLFSTVCFSWYNLSLFWSLNLSEVILWCWNCMNDLMKSDLKMSSLNIRTTYHIYYFTFKLWFFVINFFVTLTKL